MVKVKTKNQSDRDTEVRYHHFRHQHLLLFILASLLLHSLGLLLFGVYQHRHLANKEKIENKPIEFVVIPPEESKSKPPPETQKRAVEDSVAEKTTKPKEPRTTDELAQENPPPPTSPPAPSPPPVKSQAAIPPTQPKPTPPVKPQPTPSPGEKQPPVLSGSDSTSVTKPKPKPAQKDNQVATRLPPNNQPSNVPPSVPSQPNTPNTTGNTGAAGLLGGDYQKTLADGGSDAFFSPEALAYEKVLDPDQINALKDIDLSAYFAEIKRRVKSNWHPSYAAEEYTTMLTFAIQKDGQITGLQVIQSSGSEQVDRESLAAVQNSAPFAPLPPEFPLADLKVEFSFNIYIY